MYNFIYSRQLSWLNDLFDWDKQIFFSIYFTKSSLIGFLLLYFFENAIQTSGNHIKINLEVSRIARTFTSLFDTLSAKIERLRWLRIDGLFKHHIISDMIFSIISTFITPYHYLELNIWSKLLNLNNFQSILVFTRFPFVSSWNNCS